MSQTVSEIVQFPAIEIEGRAEKLIDQSLRELSYSQLKAVADFLGGKVVWVKWRVIHEPVDEMCTAKDCWR